jgi:alkanesulfonate monooxygenase SsuD/methylene tetrahydromethanopterin reductase-like flavin-dependent oxidoreductase (luciferase family)
MKLAIELGPPDDEWEPHLTYALEAERLGIDFVWSPELWGYDAVGSLAPLLGASPF